MLKNRPKDLDLPNSEYIFPIGKEFFIDRSQIPELLNFQIELLFGICPSPLNLGQVIFGINPSDKEISYYKKENTKFQMINIVLNMHSIVDKNGKLFAHPYSLSLCPGTKREEIQFINIDLIKCWDLEKITLDGDFYVGYTPFHGKGGLLCGPNWICETSKNQHIDTIGFIIGTYFLNCNFNKKEVMFPTPRGENMSKNIFYQLREYNFSYFLKPFKNPLPRVVWGAGSPIELFLIQGLSKVGLFPIIQTEVFNDGTLIPHFYSRIEKNLFLKENKMITSIDLFFADIKLAIFCDGKSYHSGEEKKKDELINKKLENIGIVVLRFSGKEITENLNDVITIIKEKYNEIKK